MEMILNENDLVIGAIFDGGTIQDYVDDEKTYGLVRFEDTTANWFLYNEEDSTEDLKKLFKEVSQKDKYIHDEFGEMIVLFDKKGDISYEILCSKIDDYLNDGFF